MTKTTDFPRKLTEYLACKLTDDEVRAKGAELAQALEDIKSEESRQDALKTSMKSAMAAIEARRDSLASIVRRCEEHRNIEVEESADYAAGKVYRTRLDTGVVIHERPLTNEERQATLALV